MNTKLTVGELIKKLSEEDPNAVVAIQNNGYPYTTAFMTNEGWLAGEFYMKHKPLLQDEYLLEDEIPKEQKKNYIKTIVIGAII